MKKIPSLFKRNYGGDRLVYNEVVEGCEWVLQGQGRATIKWDGTACMVRNGRLYKRYDRKPTRQGKKKPPAERTIDDYKLAPRWWEPCEPTPNFHTGHWPGWVPVGDGPDDQYHREAFTNTGGHLIANGTFEAIGPRIQGNPHDYKMHYLVRHGGLARDDVPRDFEGLRAWLEENECEGIVWHHPDGRMAKIKRRDFGLPWPPPGGE